MGAIENPLQWDYAKFFIGSDAENSQLYLEAFRAAAAAYERDYKVSVEINCPVLPGSKTRDRKYYIEVWGVSAGVVSYLDPIVWAHRAQRLDVKRLAEDLTDARILEEGVALVNSRERFNVQLFNGKARSKKNGKTGGGVGWALGSHKSDCRVTCYKRPGQVGGWEVQLQGPVLERLRMEAKKAQPSWLLAPLEFWKHLKQSVFTYGMARLTPALANAVLWRETQTSYLSTQVDTGEI